MLRHQPPIECLNVSGWRKYDAKKDRNHGPFFGKEIGTYGNLDGKSFTPEPDADDNDIRASGLLQTLAPSFNQKKK